MKPQKFKSQFDHNNNRINDIEYDPDGWVMAKKYKPVSFTLVHLKTNKNTVIGWWCGNEWYSPRLKKDDEVILWKKKVTRVREI